MSPGNAMLARIEAKLEPEEAAWLRDRLDPPSLKRRRVLDARDALIRSARHEFFPGDLRQSARQMEQALTQYANGAGRWERSMPQLPQHASARHVALYRILRACGGRTLGTEQLFNIFRGERTPIQIK